MSENNKKKQNNSECINVVFRTELSNIHYNHKLSCSENDEVVVVTDGIIRTLKQLEENIINPKKLRFWQKKLDKQKYTIFTINKAFHDSTWNGMVQYKDKEYDNIIEPIYIKANYSFRIEKGDRFIQALYNYQPRYSKAYIDEKINSKLDNLIKCNICKLLNENGFIKSQELILDCAHLIESKLNNEIFINFGIKIYNLNLIIKEDDKHIANRNDYEWNKLYNK